MGILQQQKEIDNKLNFYIMQDDLRLQAAYISTVTGAIRVENKRIDTVEDSIALCEWYLKTVKEL